jgi:hypothetical protein
MSGVTTSILEVGLSRRSALLRPMVDGNTGSGFEYVLAKYDGPSGAAFSLPTDSPTIWLNGQQNGYGLSHWTGFNPGPGTGPGSGPGVPDAGSTLALIRLAVTGLDLLRRRLS